MSLTDILANTHSLLKERGHELGLSQTPQTVPYVYTLQKGETLPQLHMLPLAEKRRLLSDLSSALERFSEMQEHVKKWEEDLKYLEYEVESTILREGLEKLPDELVLTIFEHAANYSIWNNQFSFSLSCVSRRFRSITLGCAALWSCILIGDKVSMIPTMLERSRNHPLRVRVHSSETRDKMSWQNSGMERAQERIQRLEVNSAAFEEISLEGLYKTTTPGNQRCFDNLRTISVEYCCERGLLYSLFQAMAQGILPSLTHISYLFPHSSSNTIVDPHAYINSNPIIRLKTLSIKLCCENDQDITWDSGAMSAFRFPDLHQLRISYSGLVTERFIYRYLEDLEPERLDHLQSLKLVAHPDIPFTVNGGYLEVLSRFPNLRDLRILGSHDLTYNPDLDNIIPRKLPQLATVAMDVTTRTVSPLLEFARMLRRSLQWNTFKMLSITIRGGSVKSKWKSSEEGQRCMNEYKEILDGKVEFT